MVLSSDFELVPSSHFSCECCHEVRAHIKVLSVVVKLSSCCELCALFLRILSARVALFIYISRLALFGKA